MQTLLFSDDNISRYLYLQNLNVQRHYLDDVRRQ